MARQASGYVLFPLIVIGFATAGCPSNLESNLGGTTAAATGCATRMADGTLSVPPHHLVFLAADDESLASVVWDKGLATEHTIPGALFGGYIFSVPPDAPPGAHPVALSYSVGTSTPVTVNVSSPPAPFGAPRIDHVSLLEATFDGSGGITAGLYLSGANFDVGAVVLVVTTDARGIQKKEELATVAHKGMLTDLYGVSPAQLGYPICHFLSLYAVPNVRSAGSLLTLMVRNLDGTESPPFPFPLPANAATLDSDGDSLLDSWETNGYDANGDGMIDVDLPALGAKIDRRDVFVELDVMAGLTTPIKQTSGSELGTLDLARKVFADAPILNPLSENGINLVIDDGSLTASQYKVIFDTPENSSLVASAAAGTVKFSTLKAANFDNAARGQVFHYAIWAQAQTPRKISGISDMNTEVNPVVGDDFLITLDMLDASYQTVRSQVEAFVHELGHDLGQRHNGMHDTEDTPNYMSVMTYTWILRTGWTDDTNRINYPTCLPFYYAQAGATEPNGSVPDPHNTIVNFSSGMGKPLVENTHTLDESTGVCGFHSEWDGNPLTTASGLNADVNKNGSTSETVTDFANWPALRFSGPQSNGSLKP